MLIMVYGLGWLLFRSCFDFGFLRGTDLYVEAMDPKGRFNAWQAICASVLSVSVIYALVLLDFYPISLLKHWSAPARSAAASVLVLIVAGAIYWLTTQIMGIDPVKVLAYGPVCFIFGALMFLLPFQRYAFSALAQPAKGATQIGVCVLLGAALSGIFLLSTHFHGDHVMQSGLPTYEQELWLSSALLGLTFPLIVIYSDFLNSWPIEKGT
jgi:hypothetical protein